MGTLQKKFQKIFAADRADFCRGRSEIDLAVIIFRGYRALLEKFSYFFAVLSRRALDNGSGN